MTSAQVLQGAAALLVGYAVGSVSPSALIARARGIDLRSAGSGNPGATNAGRVMGRSVGYLVGLIDVLKGFVPTVLALWLFGTVPALLAGLGAVLGHVSSPWLRGHGGKGVATSFGAVLGVAPVWALIAIAVFLVVFAVTRWVALASIGAAMSLVVTAVAVAVWGEHPYPGAFVGWAVVLAAIVISRHRSNVLARWRARKT